MAKPKLTDHLDTLFEKLDATKISKKAILESEKSKEHYESRLMFAFRKLQAARHHLDNVHLLKAETLKELEKAEALDVGDIESKTKLGGMKARLTIHRSANEYAFELSACLAAIKSSLDFLATVCALHMSGVEADSIRTLMRLVEKGSKKGPFLDEVAEKLEWLHELRDYRDYLVHRLVVLPTSGWTIESIADQTVKAAIPVIVPQGTPKFVPDTRRARMMENDRAGLMESKSEAWVSYDDGTRELHHHSVSYEPAPGFLAVEDLMAHHITELEAFFAKIVDRLIVLDFKPASLQ